MNTKKTAFITAGFIFAISAIVSANSASAAEWTPLVRIPGLPAAGTVNLSMYLIGLYNFLLSVVGIVAVVMLIIGGMRYITAVGNPSAISDAKDIVSSAIIGLILALLSWVFISTINPDVLYIKRPGSAGVTDPSLAVKKLGNCWTTYTVATGACVCKDGFNAPAAATEQICQDFCLAGHCNLPTPTPCIAPGSPVDSGSFNFSSAPYSSRCQCIDQAFVAPLIGMTCQATCAANNCFVADFRIGFMTVDDLYTLGTYPSDYARAKAYAIYSTKYESPLEANVKDITSCDVILAINAVDYIISPPGVPAPTYSFDVNLVGTIGAPPCINPPFDDVITDGYAVPLAGGYFGFIACNIPPYECLNDETECKFESWSNSIICPMKIKVDWGGGNVKYATQFIKWYAP